MSVMTIMRGWLRGKETENPSMGHPADMLKLLTESFLSSSGSTVNASTALRVTAVYSCVRLISQTIAGLPLYVYKRRTDGGKDRAPEHPLWRVLTSTPNQWQTIFEFVEMLTIHALLRGNGYAWMNWQVNPASGKPFIAELIPLHPDCVRVDVGKDRMPRYYWTPDPGAKEVELPWTDVFHLKGMTLNGYTGVSVISAQREAIGMGLTLQEYAGSLFANGARIGGVLEHPGVLNDEVAKRIRDSWQEAYAGAKNAGKVAVLEDGMKFNKVAMTAEDAQYIDMRKMSRTDIASMFGVPPHKIGDLERSTNNNIEHQAIEFVSDCIAPWLRRWELTIGRDLITAPDLYFVRFYLDAYLRGDMKTRYEAYKIGREGGWLSPNDVREKEDMNPIPKGDSYMEPLNFKPLGSPAPTKPGDTALPAEPPKSVPLLDVDRVQRAFDAANESASNIAAHLRLMAQEAEAEKR